MEELGNEMIENCGGLPLAITILGGLLAAKHTLEEWKKVLGDVKSYLYVQEHSRINKVLALSYDDLPCQLRPCFLYLGHFPEDFEISTKKLIRMWMAEGFIPQRQCKGSKEETMEDVGEQFLEELMQRCMVQKGKMSTLGRIKTCQMHDIMRDFCISKAQGENFLQIMNISSMEEREAAICKTRRLAINYEEFSFDPLLPSISENYPYLRSLLYFGSSRSSRIHYPRFKKFKSLRVLGLENCEISREAKLEDIGCLAHLRFLSLRNCLVLINQPSSIGNLSCLHTLDLRLSVFPVTMPNVFKNMEQLRHLYLPEQIEVSEKLELTNLRHLQTLVNIPLDKFDLQVKESTRIQIPTRFTFNRLRVLGVICDLYSRVEEGIIPIVSSCPHVHKLHLHLVINKLPNVNQFSPNLVKLTLHSTKLKEDPMATLEKLPNLKILRLVYDVFMGKTMVCSERGFPLLQSLVLSHLNLEGWRVEEGAMPSLWLLEIERCLSLKTIPDGLRFVTTLRELEIKDMSRKFKDKVDEGGEDFWKVKHVPSRIFLNCDHDW